MPHPLSHLYALALRSLETQERRATDLRARLAPVLAAGGVGATLLAPDAAHAVRSGSMLGAVVLVATSLAAVGTAVVVWRVLAVDDTPRDFRLARLHHSLASSDALDDERRFLAHMIAVMERRERAAEAHLRALRRQFTAMMCGILLVLCGLALAAFVA